ncbi:MAG: cupredoxin domain-containing protein [Chloroflexota bacterium]
MTPDQIVVTVVGIAAALGVAWFFWFKRSEGVKAVTVSDGYQEQMILVKGGYTPDTIRVSPGRPVRLLFRREETAACSEQVVLADYGKAAPLPTGTVVPIEFMPGDPGEHEFTCQMGMLRGRIIVEAA